MRATGGRRHAGPNRAGAGRASPGLAVRAGSGRRGSGPWHTGRVMARFQVDGRSQTSMVATSGGAALSSAQVPRANSIISPANPPCAWSGTMRHRVQASEEQLLRTVGSTKRQTAPTAGNAE